MSTFQQSIRSKDFVVTVEPPLHPAQSVEELQATFDVLAPVVDAVQIGDNEGAESHIAPLAVAKIAQDAGVDAIIHMACRDRNRIALQSEMLGAAAMGLTSLFLKRGNKLPEALRGRVKGVFDSRTPQLLRMASRIDEYSPVVQSPGLFLGAYVTLMRPGDDWQAEKVFEKIDAGANFLQTRPCLNVPLLGAYLAGLVAQKVPHRASVIAGVPLIQSVADARAIVDRFPDAPIPDAIVERIATSDDSREEGIAVLAETICACREIPGLSGVNISYVSDHDAAVAAIRRLAS